MQAESFVIVNLHSPTERFVGRLIDIGAPGVTLRGLDIGAFEDWIGAIGDGEEHGVCPTTVFFPLHRIAKIMLDEDMGVVPSLASQFLAKIGTPVMDYLE